MLEKPVGEKQVGDKLAKVRRASLVASSQAPPSSDECVGGKVAKVQRGSSVASSLAAPSSDGSGPGTGWAPGGVVPTDWPGSSGPCIHGSQKMPN